MLGYFDTELGRVQISPAILRGIILKEIQKSKSFLLHGVMPSEPVPPKTTERCIRVTFQEGTAEITLNLSVRYGARIIKEARELQGTIARTMQLKAGIEAGKISINVESVFEKKEAEQPVLIDYAEVDEPGQINAINQ